MNIFGTMTFEKFNFVTSVLTEMHASSRIEETRNFIQHGSTSVYTHCRNVAFVSLKIVTLLHLHVNEQALVRGALLHDYFLYDWHTPNPAHSLHGFRHPKIALYNAMKAYALSPVEVDIIVHHMFPLTLIPPRTLEGFIITISDKLCSVYEMFHMSRRRILWRRRRLDKRFYAANVHRSVSGVTSICTMDKSM